MTVVSKVRVFHHAPVVEHDFEIDSVRCRATRNDRVERSLIERSKRHDFRWAVHFGKKIDKGSLCGIGQ